MKILVVDDDSISRIPIKRTLRMFGYKGRVGIAVNKIDPYSQVCFDMRR
jgi:hypothetical protein